MVLVIDNYDSFTYNLVQYLGELNVEMQVRRNDEITLDAIRELKPERILVSPGPVLAARIRLVERGHPHISAASGFRCSASASDTSASATRSARRWS